VELLPPGQPDRGKRRQGHRGGDGHRGADHADQGRSDQGHPDELASGHAERQQRGVLHRLQENLAAEGLANQ
jgi:hypothetical protein